MIETSNPPPEPHDIAAAIAQIREQWNAVIENMVAACNGNASVAAQLAPFFDRMAAKDDWRALIGVLRRILAGERDALALLRGLDETDALVAGDVLRGLEKDEGGRMKDEESSSDADHDDKMVSLEDFLRQVVRACMPDAPAGLAEQMRAATRGMATQAHLSPELQELGRVLNQILSGERNPALTALPPQLARAVRQMLAQLT